VIDNNICYPKKISYDLQQLFATRYRLHKQVYNHPICRIIDIMMKDVLVLSDEVFQISDSIEEPSLFYQIDDHILSRIEFYSKVNENIANAKNILRNVKMRKIYKYVGEIICKDNENEIREYFKKEKHVIMDFINMGYVGNARNPLQNIRYYNPKDNQKSFNVDIEDISMLIPFQCQEKVVRIYCRTRYFDKIKSLYQIFLRK
jgi:HD superfamily phosphohydrolase